MKLNIDERSVTSVGAASSTRFTIAANGKAFKVLVDKLYSDKPRAIVRELATNAFDAHIDAGCPERPFVCTLPTVFEPQFSIRDFGPGMSHQQVMHLYTTVFESTKDKDNNAVGKWGLGSKSPFAYTDAFTVRVWQDGAVRFYNVYLAADGVPVINFLGEEASDEERGMEVSFPVRPADVNDFVRATSRVLLGFTTPFLVKNASDDIYEKFPDGMVGTGWRMWPGSRYSYDTPEFFGPHVRQGCVIYPIDTSLIDNLTDLENDILSSNILFDVPIGAVEISPSREALGYDNATVKTIKECVAIVARELVSDIQKKVDASRNWIDACRVFAEVLDVAPDNVKKVLRKLVRYKNNNSVLDGSVDITTWLDGNRAETFTAGVVRIAMLDKHHLMPNGVLTRNKIKFNPSPRVYTLPAAKLTVVWEDADHILNTGSARIKSHVASGALKLPILWVRCTKNNYQFKRLLVLLGRPPVVDISTLAIQRGQSTARPRAKVHAKLFSTRDNERTPITVDVSGVQYFVRGFRDEIRDKDDVEHSVYAVEASIKALKSLGDIPDNTDVIIVPKSIKSILNKEDVVWVDVIALAQRRAAEMYDKATIEEFFKAVRTVAGADVAVFEFYIRHSAALVNTRMGGVFSKILTDARAVVDNNTNLKYVADLWGFIPSNMSVADSRPPTHEVDSAVKNIYKMYPFLNYVDLYRVDSQAVLHYIEMCEMLYNQVVAKEAQS